MNKRKPNPKSAKVVPHARQLAIRALERCLVKGMDIQAALDAELQRDESDRRDVGLATELCYGYLRMKGRIEYVLSTFLRDPAALEGKPMLILGVASYEIMFLDRVPEYATVDWAVTAARDIGTGKLSGLFNAVLRKVAGVSIKQTGYLDFFRKDGDDTDFLCRYYSCPRWIVELWLEAYGRDDTEKYLAGSIQPPALGVNLFEHPDADELYGELACHDELIDLDGLGLAFNLGTRLPRTDKPVKRQSFAAREALMALDPQSWPQPVWDACSGRGGKTRILRELSIKVFASDVHRGRLRALKREQRNVPVFCGSAETPVITGAKTILLDLPCSGLGVLSRRPDAKWRRTPEDLNDLAKLQGRIMDNALSLLPKGGRLAVVTCTLNPTENEDMFRAALERNGKANEIRTWSTPSSSPLNEYFWAGLAET